MNFSANCSQRYYIPEIEGAQVFLDIYLNLYYQFNLSLKRLVQGVLHSCLLLEYVHRVSVLSPGVKCYRLRGGLPVLGVGSTSECINLLRLISAAGQT